MKLETKKAKEWREWGKDAFKSSRNMMKTNCKHPDYDTEEKREAKHDIYDGSYMLTPEHAERLRTRFNYDNEMIAEATQLFIEGYDASRAWYKKNDAKQQEIIDKYMPIFKEAEKIASEVDISDLKDGFPCGSAHLYLQHYPEAEELYKALGHFSTSKTDVYKYELPIKMPCYGQCISFDERICKIVNEFLRSKGIFASVYSWID